MFKPANKKSKVLGAMLFWSSSEFSAGCAYYVGSNYGGVGYLNKRGIYYVRAFAALA